MASKYSFTLSPEDQELFIDIDRSCNYEDVLNKIIISNDEKTNFKDTSSSHYVLSKIDKKIMLETILNFPIELALNDREIYVGSDRIYDVRFMMPLLYHAVSPSLLVNCRDFIAKRCLALTITGLSSEDIQMRALCYVILERYYHHLQSALMIDAKLWINFLDLLRSSIPSSNIKLRYIFTTFLCKIIDVLLHPEKDKLYELIKEFLAGRPKLNLDTIEIYDDLLLCSDVDYYKYNLRWLVTLFRDGLKAKNDLKIVIDLNIIPQIMCLYNSELRFDRANETICSVFIRIMGIENGAKTLINEYSFLPWLNHIILYHLHQELEEIKHDVKSESLSDIVKSISSLVFSLIDSTFRKQDSEEEEFSFCRLLEVISVFVTLHDLIIKSKSGPVLEYYLNYVRKVAKAIRKDRKIPDQMAAHLLELMKMKMPYLT